MCATSTHLWLLVNAYCYIPPLHGEVGMTSRLVLCLGDLFIPDRAPVSSILPAAEVCDTNTALQDIPAKVGKRPNLTL